MKRILFKMGFCFASFGSGMAWGVVAEAAEMGRTFTNLLG